MVRLRIIKSFTKCAGYNSHHCTIDLWVRAEDFPGETLLFFNGNDCLTLSWAQTVVSFSLTYDLNMVECGLSNHDLDWVAIGLALGRILNREGDFAVWQPLLQLPLSEYLSWSKAT